VIPKAIIHAALHKFQAVDLAFGLTITSRQSESRLYGCSVAPSFLFPFSVALLALFPLLSCAWWDVRAFSECEFLSGIFVRISEFIALRAIFRSKFSQHYSHSH
jgi:hypothetical protein